MFISRIVDRLIQRVPQEILIPAYPRGPAIFLDRDGTINESVEYLHEPHKLKLFPGAVEAIRRFKQLGYRVVVVTNQAGIGLGYFTKEDFFAVNRELLKSLGQAGVYLDRVYFCPHSQADNCPCRKPKVGLGLRAAKDLNLDLASSVMVGDMTGDIKFGKDLGCKSILVQTGSAGKDGLFSVAPDYSVADLGAAAELVASWGQAGKFANDVYK